MQITALNRVFYEHFTQIHSARVSWARLYLCKCTCIITENVRVGQMFCYICSLELRYDQRFSLHLFNYSFSSLCMRVHLAASFESLYSDSEDKRAGKYSALGEPLLETLVRDINFHCFWKCLRFAKLVSVVFFLTIFIYFFGGLFTPYYIFVNNGFVCIKLL